MEAAGVTLPDSREIVFHLDELNLGTVIHELVHAYYDGLCVSSAELTNDQVEEVFAELFAVHGPCIIKQARKLLRELRAESDS
jgi:hypothetical protein